jgi:hypothetical protein
MGQVQLFEGNGHAGLTSQSACPYKGSCLEKVKVEAGLGTIKHAGRINCREAGSAHVEA